MAAFAHRGLGGGILDWFDPILGWLGAGPEAKIDNVEAVDDDFSWGLIDQADAPAAEELINRFAARVGYSPVPQDGDVGLEDARRAVEAYRWAIEHYMNDQARAGSISAEITQGIRQMGLGRWFWNNGPELLGRLEDVDGRIESGELAPVRRAPLGLTVQRSAVIGAALVAGALFMSGRRS